MHRLPAARAFISPRLNLFTDVPLENLPINLERADKLELNEWR